LIFQFFLVTLQLDHKLTCSSSLQTLVKRGGQLCKQIDLGCVIEHYFLLMAGIGLDGHITQKVEQHPLKRLGVVGYLLASIWYGLRYRSFVTSVFSNEREEKTSALQIVVGNTQLYGGAIKFTWQA
jgi:diacylglycerol kinase family enzyme